MCGSQYFPCFDPNINNHLNWWYSGAVVRFLRMLSIRNISYLSPMCGNFWEKCINSHKIGLGFSTPLIPFWTWNVLILLVIIWLIQWTWNSIGVSNFDINVVTWMALPCIMKMGCDILVVLQYATLFQGCMSNFVLSGILHVIKQIFRVSCLSSLAMMFPIEGERFDDTIKWGNCNSPAWSLLSNSPAPAQHLCHYL